MLVEDDRIYSILKQLERTKLEEVDLGYYRRISKDCWFLLLNTFSTITQDEKEFRIFQGKYESYQHQLL